MRAPAAALLLFAATAAKGIEVSSPEGELWAFPSLLDDAGKPLATSTLAQWFEGGRLHVRVTHRFAGGRRAVERARFGRGKELVQEAWSWEERRGDELVRAFEVDLASGRARGRKRGGDGTDETWDEQVKVKHARRETIALAGREVDADRFEVRPDLKGLEKLVELVKDPAGADVWLHHGAPPMILRIRYPLLEVRDPVVVLETLGAPHPVRVAGRRPRGATGRSR